MTECISDLLMKDKSEAGADIYKQCKVKLLQVHGPRAEDDFAKAQALVMTGLPSTAGKRIKELICKKDFKCCCPAIVGKIWRDLLAKDVRTAVASYDLATDWDNALDRADAVYNSLAVGGAVAAVAAVDLDETAPALQHDVAAMKRVTKQKGTSQNGNGQKKKRYDPNDRDTWGKPSKEFNGKNPPSKICLQHWRFGKSAHFCRRADCPMKDQISPPDN